MVTLPGSYASSDACLLNVVYSEKLTVEQNQMLARFEARTNLRPVFIHEFERGLFNAEKLWMANVGMIQTIADDVQNLEFPLV
ncbi:hypothetical protein [Pseudomonas sp. AB12(2023)]|uniref:hypothetical protein n=1 Tax=Pseudomonas sp. AB12(2023) TaxID=3048597 RepID=UPI002B22B8CC|nr:hypothetical protein [Pseudomonas sp. AB12(2023)]MEB0222103.1 hypothetical protein [Pseudomonas sp. AB12(2023)]